VIAPQANDEPDSPLPESAPTPSADQGQPPEIRHVRDDESGSADETESSEEVEQIASLVFARIENKLEQHLHTQMELPAADQAADLREKAPELYEEWIRIARMKAETEAYMQRAQYEVPERLARSGRPWAYGALLTVLAFCAFIVTYGGAAVYIAGIIAALDLVTMLGFFMGFRPELSPPSRRARKAVPPSDQEQRGELPNES
jgi:hypothetical protein